MKASPSYCRAAWVVFVMTICLSVHGQTTLPATAVTANSATLNGSLNPQGNPTGFYFRYGATTNYGNLTRLGIVNDTNVITVNSSISVLLLGINYHFQLVVTNSAGTNYGGDQAFTCGPGPGTALAFDGVNSYVAIATTGSLTGTFTVECWARPDDPAANQALIGSRSPGDESFDLMFYQGNKLHADIGNGSAWLSTAADVPLNYTTGVWYHVAYVVTPTNYTLFINGALGGSGSYASNGTPVLYDATHNLYFGISSPGFEPMNGLMDEVRIWNTARSQAQIQASMNHPLNLPQAGLMGYWRFDEVSGGSVLDASGNGFTGTLMYGTTWVPSTAPIDWPLPNTGAATDLAGASATFNGTVNPLGQASRAWFEYGLTTSYGSTTTTNNAGSGTNAVTITNSVGGLTVGATYHFRLVATTPNGNVHGADQAFTTVATAPTAITSAASALTVNSATLNGTVNPNGAATSFYFQYGPSTNYGSFTVTNNLDNGTDALAVSNAIAGLLPGATYHFQIMASNSVGTSSGSDLTFITPALVPSVTTSSASNVTGNSATLNGTVNPNGAATSFYFQYGPDTNYGSFTITNTLPVGTSVLAVSNALTGLLPGATYHFQIVAANSAGISSGSDLAFITPAQAPIAITHLATLLTTHGATLNAAINPNGATTSFYFQYGLTTNYDSFSATNSLAAGNSLLTVADAITGLTAATYHFQVVASNITGVTVGADVAFSTAIFTLLNVGLPGVADSSVAWGDFDNDGRLDILLAGVDMNGNAVGDVWRNLGNGTFTNINAGLPGVYYGSVAWGDYDNDGYLDILLTGINSNGVAISQVWRNLGNGTFTNINVGLPGVYYGSVAWGDYDNDGRLDILLTGHDANSGISQVWRNLGNGTFTNINAGLPGIYHGSVAWGDYDNDGNLDILLTGYDSDIGFISQIWRNLGNGTFTNINAGLTSVIQGGVAWGDYDNDGKLDILLTGLSTDGVTPLTQIWRNLGNGKFTNIQAGLTGLYRSSVAWGDYDNDGNLDILLAGYDGSYSISQVWRNQGDGTFTNINADLPGVYNCSVAWGDYNSDGRLDLLLAGQSGSGIILSQLWQGNTVQSNNPPTAPASLTAALKTNGVSLSWSAASDAQTPTNGLSYNLRVGTTPGGSDILASQAAGGAGTYRMAQLGNAQERLTASLTNLTNGITYYWSVQAIDTAFAGSPFATEQTFVLGGGAHCPNIFAQARSINGQIKLQFNATAGVSYTLYGATNLLQPQWLTLTNLIATSNGPTQLIDVTATNYSRRFYRLSIP